ncbi:taste receptor type 2 member 7-like [Notamacropus eugenii]|uniref:taste receptor type 2 member 7-like n=1 Tax=Notamacropus eugenii TaxID=9315 RepID=UPI003B6724EB
MSNMVEKICVTVASGEFLVGVLANGFIGIVNCMDWVKTRKFSCLNFILIGLAISRIGLLGVMTSYVFSISFYSSATLSKRKSFQVMWTLSNNSSAWFAACLSVFYFLKIANFSHPIFLWLKWRIERGVFIVLLCFGVFSFFTSLTVILICDIFQTTYDLENKINSTQKIQEYKTHNLLIMILFSMGSIIPFALSMMSCLLLVLSLWRHTWQMRQNAMSSRDISMKVHMRVMTTTMSFLFLFVLYYAGLFSILSNIPLRRRKLTILFTLLGMKICPLTHSIILIVGHNRLRMAVLRVPWKLRVCFKD